jgi:hypothetical protein
MQDSTRPLKYRRRVPKCIPAKYSTESRVGPAKYNIEELRACVAKIPLRQKTIHDMAWNLKIPRSTMHFIIVNPDNGFRKHTSAIRPALKEQNKLDGEQNK